MAGWLFKDKEFTSKDIQDWYGYTYLITNLSTGRLYIGRKFFTKAGQKQVKGKRKKIRKGSEWESYWGSNKELLADIRKLGESLFKREILRLCKTRTECAYYETLEILIRNALIDPNYYNYWVSFRATKIHCQAFAKLYKELK